MLQKEPSYCWLGFLVLKECCSERILYHSILRACLSNGTTWVVLDTQWQGMSCANSTPISISQSRPLLLKVTFTVQILIY